MEEYKRTISFIDKARNKFEIKCEITFRNNYAEFTVSGNYGNSSGQCLDNIIPANEYQKELVNIWKKWHLNDMNPGLPEQQKAIEKWIEKGNKYDYDKACEYLQSINLFEIDGFEYGSYWYHNTLPDDFQDKLERLLDNIQRAEKERKSEPLVELYPDDDEL